MQAGRIDLAREIDAAGLHSLADWLVGFTTLTVPERGIFLVAGPLGASLAGGLGVEDDDDGSHAIEALLRHVGFSSDEAGYMDSRLASGSLFASVTTRDRDILMDAVKVFSDDSAVYIPRAVTSDLAAEAAFRLLEFPPEASTNGNVVVTDVAARFFRYCESGRAGWEYEDARGRQVVDPEGREGGEIVDFIAQTIADGDEPAGRDEVRYAIIAFGGILGISKRHAAIPITQFELGEEPIRINASRDVLRDAPAYDHDTPFSRRVELAVCDYFGAQPYWTNAR